MNQEFFLTSPFLFLRLFNVAVQWLLLERVLGAGEVSTILKKFSVALSGTFHFAFEGLASVSKLGASGAH